MPKLINTSCQGSGCWDSEIRLTFLNSIASKHHGEMLSYATGLLYKIDKSGLSPHDLLNDFYLRVYDKASVIAKSYEKVGVGYLRGIMKMLFLQEIRKQRRIERTMDTWKIKQNDRYDGERAMLNKLEWEGLEEWLVEYANESHSLIFKMFLEGYSYKEISRVTNIGLGSIGSIINRTKKKLKAWHKNRVEQ